MVLRSYSSQIRAARTSIRRMLAKLHNFRRPHFARGRFLPCTLSALARIPALCLLSQFEDASAPVALSACRGRFRLDADERIAINRSLVKQTRTAQAI